MTWTLPPGKDPVLVVITDCPVCFSAGSARRGVCDICGAEVGQVPDERDGERVRARDRERAGAGEGALLPL